MLQCDNSFFGDVMNKKVFISMLILSISFLLGLYVFKIFFPQEFMMSIQNERIIAKGKFKIQEYLSGFMLLFFI